jgi:hypothetical protein
MKITIMEHVVGYMLKVLKSGKEITDYKDEFNAIRHGDYKTFLKIIDAPIPTIVKYNNGIVYTDVSNPNYDCDFEGLLKSGPSLKKFYYGCHSKYGDIIDSSFDDSVFQKLALFEIALRMHANNYNLLSKIERTKLELVIDLLGEYLSLSEEEISLIHEGRDFLNKVKHKSKSNYNWEEGALKFEEAVKLLKQKELVISL